MGAMKLGEYFWQMAQPSADDSTPCSSCRYVYGDRDDPRNQEQWISCSCSKWFHESCAENCGVFDGEHFICADCL